MHHRHPLPRIWLMTDERIADLRSAIARLPRQSGIVFRHYSLPPRERRALFERVRRAARRGHHLLLLADKPSIAQQWGADGAHDRSSRISRGLRSVAVHNGRERVAAIRIGADLIFVSPVFKTGSHPDGRTLARTGIGRVSGPLRTRTIALGGMNKLRFESLAALKLHGWAGIDAFRT